MIISLLFSVIITLLLFEVTTLDGDRLALGRDSSTYILDKEGTPVYKYAVQWSECPISILDSSPYLISLLPSSMIEIRTIEPKLFIQRIEFSHQLSSKLKSMVKCVNKPAHIFVLSTNDVYCLVRIPIQPQISQLLDKHQFELALQLADHNGDDTDDGENKKEQLVKRIKNLHAFDLFCKKKFKEALDMFSKLETDPVDVIRLFPDLLPDIPRSPAHSYPRKPPELVGADAEKGYISLIDYLVDWRHKLDKEVDVQIPVDDSQSKSSSRPKNQLRQIIDTTLLKCYLKTNDALVSSLLRLPNNYCHLEETEVALKKSHKYNELIILYQSKGMHRKALELLYKQSKKPDSVLSGHERTIQYLQNLGYEYLDLIFEYAEWVLRDYPEDGLKIFTDDIVLEVEHLPRKDVLNYLEKVNSDLVIPYLEHIIWVWHDTTADFHNTLIHKYREKVRIMYAEYSNSLPEAESPAPAGEEPGELGVMRKKLLHFLEYSRYYSTEVLPTYLLNDGLFEERAIVMGRIGNHEEALTIYVFVLNDTRKAEDYCEKMYDKDIPGNSDVRRILAFKYLITIC